MILLGTFLYICCDAVSGPERAYSRRGVSASERPSCGNLEPVGFRWRRDFREQHQVVLGRQAHVEKILEVTR